LMFEVVYYSLRITSNIEPQTNNEFGVANIRNG
jgi:hypothetical protein